MFVGEGREGEQKSWSEYELLSLAAGVERTAAHPIAKALVQAAEGAGCRPVKVKTYFLINDYSRVEI